MNYIVFDLEWNQGSTKRDRHPKEFPFEIVEIGAVRLNEKKEVTGTFHRLVKPQVYTHMHRITEDIIHLTMEDLEEGDDFETVARDFLAFCGEDFLFCTWGNLDVTELQRNMAFYRMPRLSDEGVPYYDAQKLYSLMRGEGAHRQFSLETAVTEMGISQDKPFHRALDDADYTARIFAAMPEELMEHQSVSKYEVPKKKRHRRRKRAAQKPEEASPKENAQ